MLAGFFMPSQLRGLFRRSSVSHAQAVIAVEPAGPADPVPSNVSANLRYDSLQTLSDTELARLGLSRGVLALRAGCPERVLDQKSDQTPLETR